METYDYTEKKTQQEYAEILASVDLLSDKEIEQLKDAVTTIRQKTAADKTERFTDWFNNSILPILKEFADMTSSKLEIERNKDSIFTANIINKKSLDITESCTCMRMVMIAASYLLIDHDNNNTILSLTFDSNNFV